MNKDESLNKATVIRVKGINFAKSELSKNALAAKVKLSNLGKDTEVLSELIDYICSRTS